MTLASRSSTGFLTPLQADLHEVEGQPSRWITLLALRVLRWAGRG